MGPDQGCPQDVQDMNQNIEKRFLERKSQKHYFSCVTPFMSIHIPSTAIKSRKREIWGNVQKRKYTRSFNKKQDTHLPLPIWVCPLICEVGKYRLSWERLVMIHTHSHSRCAHLLPFLSLSHNTHTLARPFQWPISSRRIDVKRRPTQLLQKKVDKNRHVCSRCLRGRERWKRWRMENDDINNIQTHSRLHTSTLLHLDLQWVHSAFHCDADYPQTHSHRHAEIALDQVWNPNMNPCNRCPSTFRLIKYKWERER